MSRPKTYFMPPWWAIPNEPITNAYLKIINEKENKEMPKKSLLERLRDERNELGEKIEKLKSFRESEAYDYLPLLDKHLLTAQENAMVTYHEILGMRINSIKKEY